MKLTLFGDPKNVAKVQRNLMAELLRQFEECLPASAAAVLKDREMGWEWYCEALAALFREPENFGGRLVRALKEIEQLSLPENEGMLQEALARVPDGWINRGQPSMDQCVHLRLMVECKRVPGIIFPVCAARHEEAQEDTKNQDPSRQPSPLEGARESGGAPRVTESQDGTAGPVSSGQDSVQKAKELDSSPLGGVGGENGGAGKGSTAASEPEATRLTLVETAARGDGELSEPEASFERLARLSAVEYDRVRREEATRLKLRVRTLDEAVEQARSAEADAEASKLHLPEVEPWPEPIVDPPGLFDKVHDRFLVYLYLPTGAAVVLTLWPAHAHALDAFTHSPRLNLCSAEPGCGKSTAFDVLAPFCPRVLQTNSLKPAVLYRIMERDCGQMTVCLDELDAYLHRYPELRGLLDASNKPGACVHRCEGNGVRAFKIYAATALAGLGHLTPTLRHRSIVLTLEPAPRGAVKARFDPRHIETEIALGRQIARWAKDNFAALAACDPVMPPAAYNRLGDNWRPLFAVAQVIGGHWPERVREAFEALSASAADVESSSSEGAGVKAPGMENELLRDIRTIFERSGAQRLFSSALVEGLRAMPEGRWSGGKNGEKPMNEARLARYMSLFGIAPRHIRIGGRQSRGYELADFARAFERVLGGE
jgi:putative DNA primase/helicase